MNVRFLMVWCTIFMVCFVVRVYEKRVLNVQKNRVKGSVGEASIVAI